MLKMPHGSSMTPKDASVLLGELGRALPPACLLELQSNDFTCRKPGAEEQREILLRVLKLVDESDVRSVSEDWEGHGSGSTLSRRIKTWNRCYESIEKPGAIPPFLIPLPGTPVRLCGEYQVPTSTHFEASFLAVIRAYLFDRFLAPCSTVYEFGCGTGHNLLALAKQQPGKRLVGLDWSESSVKLINQLASTFGVNAHGQRFDFFSPNKKLVLDDNAGVLTVGALEQVGKHFASFLVFLLAKKPTVCVHLEPIVEQYDPDELFDYVAARYHRKRGYLDGFLPALQAFEKRGSLEILAVHRIPFGSLCHEAYTYIVWKPR